jgi:hypothetical protein
VRFMPSQSPFSKPARVWRSDVLLGMVIAVVFLASALAPRIGSAVLLLPITNQAGHKALQWALANNARVLGSSVVGGIVLDHAPDQIFLNALNAGALAISVPAAACTSRPRNNR